MKKRYPQGGYHNCQVVVLLMGTILYLTGLESTEKKVKKAYQTDVGAVKRMRS